jgi:hypothetical protein
VHSTKTHHSFHAIIPPLQLCLILLNVYRHRRVPLLNLAIHIDPHACVTHLRILERRFWITALELGLESWSLATLRQARCEGQHLPGTSLIRWCLIPNGITVDIDGPVVSIPRGTVPSSVSPTGKKWSNLKPFFAADARPAVDNSAHRRRYQSTIRDASAPRDFYPSSLSRFRDDDPKHPPSYSARLQSEEGIRSAGRYVNRVIRVQQTDLL